MSASGEVTPSNPREEMRMNIHGVLDWALVDAKAQTYKAHWRAGGEARWHNLQKLVEKLAGEHKITDRAGLERAVDDAALIYHHDDALPAGDVKQLLESISEVAGVLREENDARIADILVDRDVHLIEGTAWTPGARDRTDRILKLESGLLFNPVLPLVDVQRRALREIGCFDGWEHSQERAVAIRMRLFRIRADLAQLSRALGRLPKKRKANMRLVGAVAVLKRRWKNLSGKNGMPKFVESVIVFIDPDHPDVATKLPSAMRLRVQGVAKSRA
jgi:hypothetical protein